MTKNLLYQDEFFIKETFKLARKGEGWTFPNPMVGAVIIKNGKIIGQGYHQKVGSPHAEIEALNWAKSSVKGASIYVNLEPCTHFGRTSPCVDLIINAGIKKVFCSVLDPNPQVHGKGIAALKKSGIEVTIGILEKEARELNQAFFTFHEKKRPFVALKFAASLDGKIATKSGESKWITNDYARKYSLKLRRNFQAICVGANTVIQDNPHLGTKTKRFKDPLRIIIDPSLRTETSSQVYRDSNVMAFCSNKTDTVTKQLFNRKGIHVVFVSSYPFKFREIMRYLYEHKIISLLVEGGGKVLGSFFDEKLIDKVYAFHAPILIGGEKGKNAIGGEGVIKIKDVIRLKNVSFKKFDDNILTIGYL